MDGWMERCGMGYIYKLFYGVMNKRGLFGNDKSLPPGTVPNPVSVGRSQNPHPFPAPSNTFPMM